MAGGVHCMGCARQERRPLQRTVRILLECILVLSNVNSCARLLQVMLQDMNGGVHM